MSRRAVLLTIAVLLLPACATGNEAPQSSVEPPSAVAPTQPPTESPTVVGSAAGHDQSVTAAAVEPGFVPLLAVGDIASCDTTGDEKVARLAAERKGRIAILGDAVYDDGTAQEFKECFDPAWGPMAARLRPTPGNHEYHVSSTAKAYFDYFGDWTGERAKGWYAYNAGDYWRIIVLNSNCNQVGGCTMDSPQGRWLSRAIDNAGNRHILAYWHAPLYSSGNHGPNPSMKPFFRALYRNGADVVLNGHDHHYERFAPQNAQGERRDKGVQQFVVGTGGFKHYAIEEVLPNSRVRDTTSFGLLKLRLKATGYSWTFIPSEGDFTDSGSRTLR